MSDFSKIEQTIGYTFENKDLLQQAFVRKSYSEEHGGQNNEVLEFIGDKALDFAVVRIMMEQFGIITEDKEWSEFKLRNPKHFQTRYGEGKFTDIKQDLVKKQALSKAMDSLGFQNYLIMGQGDTKQNRQDSISVKEDLFEAIIGAVALDCGWDMDTITHVVKSMIDFDSYFENGLENSKNSVALVQEWFQKNKGCLPQYQYLNAAENTIGEPFYGAHENGDGLYKCQLIFEQGYFNGYGSNNAEAREKCAECFYDWLEENGYIVDSIIEAVGDPDENQSIRQLNELYQKKLISKPIYTFKQEGYDDKGCAVWRCECLVEENHRSFYNYSSSKKEAQRMSAYESLLDLIGMYEEE